MGQSGLAVLVTPAHSSIVVDASSTVRAVVNMLISAAVDKRKIVWDRERYLYYYSEQATCCTISSEIMWWLYEVSWHHVIHSPQLSMGILTVLESCCVTSQLPLISTVLTYTEGKIHIIHTHTSTVMYTFCTYVRNTSSVISKSSSARKCQIYWTHNVYVHVHTYNVTVHVYI